MITESDAELVAATIEGDRGAFARLVGRYERIVLAVTYKIIGDHHAAEDAAQDAFVIAFRSLARLRNPALFGGWVSRIARRHAQRLSQGRRHELPLEHAAEVAGQESERTNHDAERLLALVMQLPERERQPLLLRHFGGHSVADIARMSGRPVGTITKQLSRGYARLREQLQCPSQNRLTEGDSPHFTPRTVQNGDVQNRAAQNGDSPRRFCDGSQEIEL